MVCLPFRYHEARENLEDSNRYLLKLKSPQLLLEDSAEYTELTDHGSMKKEAKTELAHKMLVKLGYTEDEANAKVDNCLAFEKTLASAIPTSQEQQHPDYDKNSNNHVTRSELKALQKQVPILQVLEESMGFAKSDDYIVKEPDYFTKLAEVYTDENLELMRDFLIVHGIKECDTMYLAPEDRVAIW